MSVLLFSSWQKTRPSGSMPSPCWPIMQSFVPRLSPHLKNYSIGYMHQDSQRKTFKFHVSSRLTYLKMKMNSPFLAFFVSWMKDFKQREQRNGDVADEKMKYNLYKQEFKECGTLMSIKFRSSWSSRSNMSSHDWQDDLWNMWVYLEVQARWHCLML